MQLSSATSSSARRYSSKIWKNFKKKTKRSFNRGRTDQVPVMFDTDPGGDCLDSFSASMESAESLHFAEDYCSSSEKHNEVGDCSSTLDSQSIDSSENVDDVVVGFALAFLHLQTICLKSKHSN